MAPASGRHQSVDHSSYGRAHVNGGARAEFGGKRRHAHCCCKSILSILVSPPPPFFSLSFRGVILFYYSALAFPSYFVRHWRKLPTSNVLALRPFRGCILAKTNKRKLIFRLTCQSRPTRQKKKGGAWGCAHDKHQVVVALNIDPEYCACNRRPFLQLRSRHLLQRGWWS